MKLKSLFGLVAGLAIALAFSGLPASAAVQLSATQRTAAMNTLVTAIGATGTIMILTGAQPANVATIDSGTVLVVLPMSSTAGTVSGGVLTFNAVTNTLATGAGTAGHYLICSSAVTATCVAVSSSTRISQGSVALSGADINFASGVGFTVGETIGITSLTYTEGGA